MIVVFVKHDTDFTYQWTWHDTVVDVELCFDDELCYSLVERVVNTQDHPRWRTTWWPVWHQLTLSCGSTITLIGCVTTYNVEDPSQVVLRHRVDTLCRYSRHWVPGTVVLTVSLSTQWASRLHLVLCRQVVIIIIIIIIRFNEGSQCQHVAVQTSSRPVHISWSWLQTALNVAHRQMRLLTSVPTPRSIYDSTLLGRGYDSPTTSLVFLAVKRRQQALIGSYHKLLLWCVLSTVPGGA